MQITSSKAAIASLLAALARHTPRPTSLLSQPSSSQAKAHHSKSSQVTDSTTHDSQLTEESTGSSASVSHSSDQQSQAKAGTASIEALQAEAALASATAVQNLLLDKEAQRLVVDLRGVSLLGKLLSCPHHPLAARAAGGA